MSSPKNERAFDFEALTTFADQAYDITATLNAGIDAAREGRSPLDDDFDDWFQERITHYIHHDDGALKKPGMSEDELP